MGQGQAKRGLQGLHAKAAAQAARKKVSFGKRSRGAHGNGRRACEISPLHKAKASARSKGQAKGPARKTGGAAYTPFEKPGLPGIPQCPVLAGLYTGKAGQTLASHGTIAGHTRSLKACRAGRGTLPASRTMCAPAYPEGGKACKKRKECPCRTQIPAPEAWPHALEDCQDKPEDKHEGSRPEGTLLNLQIEKVCGMRCLKKRRKSLDPKSKAPFPKGHEKKGIRTRARAGAREGGNSRLTRCMTTPARGRASSTGPQEGRPLRRCWQKEQGQGQGQEQGSHPE